MYNFVIEKDLKEYDEFVISKKGQFIQSSRWQNVKTTWKCTYISGFCNGERVLTALFMERNLPVAGKIVYCPCGPVCDYHDTNLLKEFTTFANTFIKDNGDTCFIMDPPISLRVNGETQEFGVNMHSQLVSMGYKLNSNISNYTYKQPVQLFIPLKDEENNQIESSKLLKKCDKGVRYSIRLGLNRGLVAKSFESKDIENDHSIIDDFANVMRDTSERDDFVERDGDYCAKLLKEFEGYSDLKIVYYDLDLDKQLETDRQKRKEQCIAQLEGAHEKKIRQLNEEINSIDKQTEHFNNRINEVQEFLANGGLTAKYKLDDNNHTVIPVAGGLSIYYAGMGSCLFGGTKNVIRNNTRSSHYLNYLRLCESINRGCDIHDLGYIIVKNPTLNNDGTLGNLEAQPNFEGIYSFKKSFGSDYHEFIGEYILVNNATKYYAYSKLMPKAKHAKIALIKLLRK